MNSRSVYVASLLLIGFLGSFQVLPNNVLALTVFGMVFLSFYNALDSHIPIIEITACIAALQWLVGPVIGYSYGTTDLRYDMYVPAARYFGYALPGTCAYLAALYLLPCQSKQSEMLAKLQEPIYFNRGLALLIISLIAQFGAGYAPGGLAFFVFLLTQLRYVGALYFLFSGHRLRYLFIAIALATLLVRSAESAMFHDLIIWVSLIACFWYQTVKWTPTKKAFFFMAGFVCVFAIQLVKADYRAKVWSGEDASFAKVAYQKLISNQAFIDKDSLMAAGQRINQGWIISAVMLNVPLVEDYANGETIKVALISAAVPRVFMKNKAMAGGQINFERFTGLNLENNTSMGISILGESYANYGTFGGSIFMFIWGLFYSGIFYGIVRYTVKNPAFLFWVPLIFYQAIKAETELLVVLNQLIKGSIVAIIAYYGLHTFLVPGADRAKEELELEDDDEEDEEGESNQSSRVNYPGNTDSPKIKN